MQLCCEGPRCNAGQSATAIEQAAVREMPHQTVELRDEAHKHARATTSRLLAVTPHTALERRRGGLVIYSCDICGHERVYGYIDTSQGCRWELGE